MLRSSSTSAMVGMSLSSWRVGRSCVTRARPPAKLRRVDSAADERLSRLAQSKAVGRRRQLPRARISNGEPRDSDDRTPPTADRFDAVGHRASGSCAAIRAGALATLDRDGGFPSPRSSPSRPIIDGSPLLLMSRLSAHTQNLEPDPRASILLARARQGRSARPSAADGDRAARERTDGRARPARASSPAIRRPSSMPVSAISRSGALEIDGGAPQRRLCPGDGPDRGRDPHRPRRRRGACSRPRRARSST